MSTRTVSEDDLVDIDLDSLSLTSRPSQDMKDDPRNARLVSDLSLDNESPLNNIFASSSSSDKKRRDSEVIKGKSGESRLFAATSNASVLAREIEINHEEEEEIPFIPDLDDPDDVLESGEDLPNMVVSNLVNMQELDMDVDNRKTFFEIDGIDISLISSRLLTSELLQEDDEPWTWEGLLSQVSFLVDGEKNKF